MRTLSTDDGPLAGKLTLDVNEAFEKKGFVLKDTHMLNPSSLPPS
jgi:hypothetical protein